MKIFFTLLFLCICIVSFEQSSFQPSSIIVYRVGDGQAPLRNVSTSVFLDEYSPSGTLIQSIALPNVAGTALTASGSATSEGMMNRSADGKYLMMTGYNADTGVTGISSSAATVVKRVVGRVDAFASINIATQLGANSFSGNNIRSATSSNGSDFWIAGAGSATGISYGLLGDTGSKVSATAGVSNLRNINIFDGSLFISTNSGSAVRIGKVGNGLPTDSGNIINPLPGIPLSGSPYGFFFADLNATIPGVDVLYVADDGAATGILKYSFDGTTWNANGNALPAITGTRGLAGVVSGGAVTLYLTSGTNKLYSLTDGSGYGGAISANFTELATAATNTAFRGVTLAPLGVVTPLKLISFKAVLHSEGTNLNWITNNEFQLNKFIVQRSTDGKNFVNLITLTASNNSIATYTTTDKNPCEGVNYYRLKIIGKDAHATFSSVQVIVNHQNATLNIYPNPGIDNLNISLSPTPERSTLVITNVLGQPIKSIDIKTVSIRTNICINNLKPGNYFVRVLNGGKAISQAKFIKQ